MPPLRKNWWYFRLIIFAFAATGLGVYLFHSTPWRKALGIQPNYGTQIAEGDRLVAAIYDFHWRTQLWPQYLDDLQLPPPQYRWFYEVQPRDSGHRQPALSTDAPAEGGGGGRAHLAFAFGTRPEDGDWHVFTSAADRIERTGSPGRTSVVAHGISPFTLALIELDRRIAREPGIIEHYQDKAALLVEGERIPEARAAIAAAHAQFPDAAWPRLAGATLDLSQADRAGPMPASVDAFAAWAAAAPTFTRCCGVAWLYRQSGEEIQARIAAARAIGLPIEVDPDDPHLAAFHLYDLARWALTTERWNLAIDICNAWQKAADAGLVKDRSCFALRAAAHLAQSNFTAAQSDLAHARTDGSASWISSATDSLQSLSDAATKSNPAARLTFPPLPANFQPFRHPE